MLGDNSASASSEDDPEDEANRGLDMTLEMPPLVVVEPVAFVLVLCILEPEVIPAPVKIGAVALVGVTATAGVWVPEVPVNPPEDIEDDGDF